MYECNNLGNISGANFVLQSIAEVQDTKDKI